MPRAFSAVLPALLALLLLGLVLGDASRARAVSFDLQLGTTRLEQPGGHDFLPSFRASLGIGLIGPLELGAYMHLQARDWSWSHRATGGGGLLALRPRLPGVPLRFLLEGSLGRALYPVPQGTARAWATALAAGLGVDVSSSLTLEARVMHSWHHRIQGAPLGDAWTFSGGFTIRLL